MTPEQRPYAVIVVLGTLCVVLGAAAAHFARQVPRGTDGGLVVDAGQDDEMARMVANTSGIHDSHPDADVGRLLQPGLNDRDVDGIAVSTNRLGLREQEIALPKPEGLVRVVLLGDSYIQGMGVAAEERLGVRLRGYLEERAGVPDPSIEVLHIGVVSWNIVAECTWLRRQIELLDPDLVVHVTVPNDLNDSNGVRGFGAMARFAPRHPERADGVISHGWARWALDREARGHLPSGLDHESRTRFREASAHINELVGELEARGGRYLHVFAWQLYSPAAAHFIGSRLRPEQVLYLPTRFSTDRSLTLSTTDLHWNSAGHAAMALMLYGVISDRELLPALELEPWPEASEQGVLRFSAGEAEATREKGRRFLRNRRRIESSIDMHALTTEMAGQVHGGVDAAGLVSPYASVLLAREEGTALRVIGVGLPRPVLDGKSVEVWVDEVRVGSIPLLAGQPFDLSVPLPERVKDRPFLTVRFVSEDFVYVGPYLRHCVSFRLNRVAVEP